PARAERPRSTARRRPCRTCPTWTCSPGRPPTPRASCDRAYGVPWFPLVRYRAILLLLSRASAGGAPAPRRPAARTTSWPPAEGSWGGLLQYWHAPLYRNVHAAVGRSADCAPRRPARVSVSERAEPGPPLQILGKEVWRRHVLQGGLLPAGPRAGQPGAGAPGADHGSGRHRPPSQADRGRHGRHLCAGLLRAGVLGRP